MAEPTPGVLWRQYRHRRIGIDDSHFSDRDSAARTAADSDRKAIAVWFAVTGVIPVMMTFVNLIGFGIRGLTPIHSRSDHDPATRLWSWTDRLPDCRQPYLRQSCPPTVQNWTLPPR